MKASPMQRNPSATSVRTSVSAATSETSGRGGGSGGGAGSATARTKKSSRARDLLRDYYGLAGGSSDRTASSLPSVGEDPLNLDSRSFSSRSYVQQLLNTSTLPQLLKTSAELSSSIADLENERQSLVYNHHHELIDASVTISKMKVRAESLDTTLEQLKSGLARCSELDSGLRYGAGAAGPPSSQDDSGKQADEPDWDLVLGTMLDLPLSMQAASKEEALRLWGTYEPVLRKWRDARVEGIEDIESDCREVLNVKTGGEALAVSSATTRRRSGSTMTIRP